MTRRGLFEVELVACGLASADCTGWARLLSAAKKCRILAVGIIRRVLGARRWCCKMLFVPWYPSNGPVVSNGGTERPERGWRMETWTWAGMLGITKLKVDKLSHTVARLAAHDVSRFARPRSIGHMEYRDQIHNTAQL